ncbi:BREX-3 system P-loop-containing protein BrxF [Sphingobium yanoikuyae]|uniref:BREX-3 system P-loop-containing protein BrxF n=1 Tax=Sphingobium yanoikuyae TaxID=13690 RepID=UPI002FDD92D1
MTMIDHQAAARDAIRLLNDQGFSKGKPVVVAGNETIRRGTLTAVSSAIGITPINLNVMLAEALLDGNEKIDIGAVIAAMAPGNGPLLLDRIQILMLPQLHVNAVNVLCRVARRRPVYVSWPGRLEGGRLKYAHPDHPECLDEDVSRVVVIDLSTNEGPET